MGGWVRVGFTRGPRRRRDGYAAGHDQLARLKEHGWLHDKERALCGARLRHLAYYEFQLRNPKSCKRCERIARATCVEEPFNPYGMADPG